MIRPVCQEDFCECCGRCLDCHGGDPCGDGELEHVWPERLRDPLTKTGLPRCGHPKRGGGWCALPSVAGFEKCWRHRHLEGTTEIAELEEPICRECRSRTADPSIMKGLCWHCANDLVENGVRQ